MAVFIFLPKSFSIELFWGASVFWGFNQRNHSPFPFFCTYIIATAGCACNGLIGLYEDKGEKKDAVAFKQDGILRQAEPQSH